MYSKHARITLRDEYRFIDAMFRDGFEAWEVVELCEDWDMPRVDAVVLTQFWLQKHGEKDTFEINCTDAEHYFYPDGNIKLHAYLKIPMQACTLCDKEVHPYLDDDETPAWCESCAGTWRARQEATDAVRVQGESEAQGIKDGESEAPF